MSMVFHNRLAALEALVPTLEARIEALEAKLAAMDAPPAEPMTLDATQEETHVRRRVTSKRDR